MNKSTSLMLVLILLTSFQAISQRKRNSRSQETTVTKVDTSLYSGLKWRNIGPFRGGRSVAVTGVPGNDQLYYMGSTGGGVWKTEDAGNHWQNISDGFFKTGSVGDIAVSSTDPNVIYVGMGEHAVRGVMTSFGDGVYKSTDAGKTWKHLGLELTRHISDVIIHPSNPDIVYVAAQGTVHGPSEERGIYRSMDGGNSWEKVLFVDENSGASSFSMDVTNPRILYAAFWDHIRLPWQVKSGGKGSGIYKSVDGGENWTKLTEGLPKLMGKIGVSVSPANPDRVWAVIEAEKGGVFRSDNGGKKWNQVSSDRATITRSWYYNEIFADPADEETVYVLNAQALRSIDGGRTFRPMPVGHGDTHDLWINPANNKNFILGDDGGAEITFNTGRTWSTLNNQPTAQFYRVNTDNLFPFNVYGGQQDNSSVIINSRSYFGSIGEKNWTFGPGCESAYLAFDPDNPVLVYGGCYQGNISVLNRENFTQRDIMAYPFLGLGKTPSEMKYRFNWNAPIVASPHDPAIIYHAGNLLLKTTDGGTSWEAISGDLTRNDKNKQVQGGAPITNEAAGGENYNTIMYVAVSPHKAGTIWVGSDDGLLHLTTDEGQNWQKVTPPNLGETLINSIEISPFDDKTVYVVSTRYKFNDFSPVIHVTRDQGKTWEKMVKGIEKDAFVRVVREDPIRKDLLYAGTEKGMYISYDGGKNWTPFQLNLPIVPINDLKIQNNDLVAATAGRAFWILDELGSIQQSYGKLGESAVIFQPKDAVRLGGGIGRRSLIAGQNPLPGVIIDYYLPSDFDSVEVKLEIQDNSGKSLQVFKNIKDKNYKPFPGGPPPSPIIPAKKGINRISWNLQTQSLPGVPGIFVMGGYGGHMVPPGDYKAIFTVEDVSQEISFSVKPNPNMDFSEQDYAEQEEFMNSIEDRIRDLHESVADIREVRNQINSISKNVAEIEEADTLVNFGKHILDRIGEWEERLVQPKQKTFQDVINFPNQLNSEWIDLKSRMDGDFAKITEGAKVRFNDLDGEWDVRKQELNVILNDLDRFNALYKELDLPAVFSDLR